MSDHCLQVLTLALQTAGIVGLFIYCFETYQIRKAAQEQVGASQKLIRAATDQVEGLAKPCLTIWGDLRDGADAILEMHGAIGNVVVRPDGGSYVVQNIGNGVALNIRYLFTRAELPHARDPRYIPYMAPTARVTLVETLGGYNAEHEVTFDYESIGGRKYRTTINLNQHVIISFRFQEIQNP